MGIQMLPIVGYTIYQDGINCEDFEPEQATAMLASLAFYRHHFPQFRYSVVARLEA